MGWTVPDKGEGLSDIQSILWQEQLDVLAEGLEGINCVLFGGVCTSNSNMTVAVSEVSVMSNRADFRITGANVTITTADATNPRLDLIVVTSAGALAVRAGTAAAAPKPPGRTTNDVVLACVYVPANDTVIAANQITDWRAIRGMMAPRMTRKTANTSVSTTAFADVADMDFYVAAGGIYLFEYNVYFQTNATTVGIRLAVNCTSAPTSIKVAGTIASAVPSNAVTFASAVQTAKDTAIFATTTGPGAVTSLAVISGVITVGAANDTLKLRHGSETATATTIMADSWGRLTRIG